MLTVSELERSEKERAKVKKEFYKKMYDDLSKKVKHAALLHQKQCILKVPHFVFGFPSYDITKATKYMQRQFELGGFRSVIMGPDQLHISWERKKATPLPTRGPDKPPDELPSFVNLKKLANKYR